MSQKSTATTAFDPSAPEAERFDAQAELQSAHIDRSSLIPPEHLKPLIDFMVKGFEEQELVKASSTVVPFPSKNAGKKGVQSIVVDDLNYAITGEYVERPGAMNFTVLRGMVEQTPVLSAVVMTRVRQVQAFCKVQESGFGPGFVIRHADKAHKLTDDERKTTELLQRFFLNTGWEFNPRQRKRLGRQSLRQFIALSVRDSLAMDSAPIETEMKRNKALGIDGFYAVDGATIRLCTDEGYRENDEIFALQVVQGNVRTAYDYNGLIYEPRNPRTDVMASGYGLSETELLVKVVTGFLNAMTLNIRGFSDNSIPKGVLHLSGNYSESDLASFKRYWNGMVKGVNNAWSVPVLVSKDQESKAAFENFGVSFDEMQFSKWMTFLTSIICAIYGMSPAEINFDSFSGGNTSPLGGSDTAEKLAASKDSGLRPLLAYYESLFSDYILADFGDSYVFRWTGVDEDDQDKRHELKKLVMSVNEMRAELGLDAQTDSWGEAPLNPSLIGPWSQTQQAAQQPGPDMQSADQAPGFGGQDGDQAGDDGAPGDDAGEDEQPGQAQQQADPGADPGDQPMRKANDEHDLVTGQFIGRTHQVRMEKRSLRDLYNFTRKYPLASPDSMLVNMGEDDLRVQMEHGPSVEAGDGRIEVTGKRLSRQFGTTKGSGMVKVIWRHGEKSGKPDGMRVTRGDVMALPEVLRTMPSSIALDANEDPVRWEWQRPRFDGETVVYAASRFKAKDDHNHVVSIHVVAPQMKKSDSNPGGELFALKHQIPSCDLSIVQQAVEPLNVYYADAVSVVNVDVFAKAIPTSSLLAAAKRGQPENEEAKPHPSSYGVGVHDEVFFHHPQHGATSGKVLAYGADGFTAEHKSGRVGVPWDALLGHKQRAERTLTTVEAGEAGSIVKDEATGRQHFLAGNAAEFDGEDPELDDERALILGTDNSKE